MNTDSLLHPRERERLASLREFEPFTLPGDPAMASIVREAIEVCTAPMGAVSLMERGEEWLLASVGTPVRHVERSHSMCAHAILEPYVLVVEDTHQDPRFRNLPHVVEEPFVRFYVGAPIVDAKGLPLGVVCVFDTKPHEISSPCPLALGRLAEVAAAVLESRRLLADARNRPSSEAAKAASVRFDALLLTLIEHRPSCA